jgi:thioredoxin 1
MSFTRVHRAEAPARAEVDRLGGVTLLEFGTAWCGHCQRAQPLLEAALAGQPEIQHLKIEDGPGRPLGRSYGVKLWPTLIVLRDGRECARRVRPTRQEEIESALQAGQAGDRA